MGIIKDMKSSTGKEAINEIDQKLSMMFSEYRKHLNRAGTDVTLVSSKNMLPMMMTLITLI